MDSEQFTCTAIFEVFKDEFLSSRSFWWDFIKSKDLGIMTCEMKLNDFIIIDKGKWLFAKIKYGF